MHKQCRSTRPVWPRPPIRATLAGWLCVAAAFALSACSQPDDGKTVGQNLDAAVAKTRDVASGIKSGVQDSAVTAGTAIQAATQDAKDAAVHTGQAISGSVDDAAITASVAAGLAKDPDLSAFKIDIDTASGIVSFYGPAPSESARERASAIARAVKGVVGVNNRLTVKTG